MVVKIFEHSLRYIMLHAERKFKVMSAGCIHAGHYPFRVCPSEFANNKSSDAHHLFCLCLVHGCCFFVVNSHSNPRWTKIEQGCRLEFVVVTDTD